MDNKAFVFRQKAGLDVTRCALPSYDATRLINADFVSHCSQILKEMSNILERPFTTLPQTHTIYFAPS